MRNVGQIALFAVAFALVPVTGCVNKQTFLTFHPGPVNPIIEDWDPAGKSIRGGVVQKITTEHFELYTTANDAEFVAFLPEYLETTYAYYASLIPEPDTGEPHARLKTYLLNDRPEWDRFVQENYPERHEVYRRILSGGFSEGGTCVVFFIGRTATLGVLAHEGLHQYLGSRFPEPVPAWVNEGLASYCESVEVRGRVPHFRPMYNTFRVDHLRCVFFHGETLPLLELLSTDAGRILDGDDTPSTMTYYAQAWALVSYLRHGDGGRYAGGFKRLLDDIANGTIRIKAQAAKVASASPSEVSYGEAVFRAYITTDFEGFERDFLQYVHRVCYPKNPMTAILEPLFAWSPE